MKIAVFYVNAFAETLFEGNPAAICPLDAWLDDDLMQQIAAQNNLSETAFFIAAEQRPQLRWFSPSVEVDFCGHATLAAAHIALRESGKAEISFETKRGILSVKKINGAYQMDFPKEESHACDIPADLAAAMGAAPISAQRGANMMVVYEERSRYRCTRP